MRFEARERYGAGELQASASWSEVAGGIVGRVAQRGVFPGDGPGTICRIYSLVVDSADTSIDGYAEAVVHTVYAGLRAVREALNMGAIAPGQMLEFAITASRSSSTRVVDAPGADSDEPMAC